MKKKKRFTLAAATVIAATFGISGCHSNVNVTVYGPPSFESDTHAEETVTTTETTETEMATDEITTEPLTESETEITTGEMTTEELTESETLTEENEPTFNPEDNTPVAVYGPPSWFE